MVKYSIIAKEIDNAKPSILYSECGNITLKALDIDITGIIYAPNGTVFINGTNVKSNGIIIADKIVINGKTVTIDNKFNLYELRENDGKRE